MAWIESHQELARHPKVLRLARILKVNKAQAIGHLHLLWWWTLDFSPTGDLSAFTSCELGSAAEWQGDGDCFKKALQEAGWLDGDVIHDWPQYSGRLLAVRESNRERQKRYRARSALRHGDVTVTSRVTNGATVPNPTEPNQGRGARAREAGPPSPKVAGAGAPPPPMAAAPSRGAGPEPLTSESLTNKPTMAQALKQFSASDYRGDEVKAAYLTFEANKGQDGSWWWGKRMVGDWRAAMESRMSETRTKTSFGKPAISAAESIRRIAANVPEAPNLD